MAGDRPAIRLKKIISGGQTGADRGALEAGKRLGYETGGTVPRGYRTNRGPDQSLREFGVKEHSSAGYPPRTIRNIKDSDGTVWFGNAKTPGGKLTLGTARQQGKPFIVNPEPAELTEWLADYGIETLNVAGDREENDAGIQKRVEDILEEALLR